MSLFTLINACDDQLFGVRPQIHTRKDSQHDNVGVEFAFSCIEKSLPNITKEVYYHRSLGYSDKPTKNREINIPKLTMENNF